MTYRVYRVVMLDFACLMLEGAGRLVRPSHVTANTTLNRDPQFFRFHKNNNFLSPISTGYAALALRAFFLVFEKSSIEALSSFLLFAVDSFRRLRRCGVDYFAGCFFPAFCFLDVRFECEHCD